MNAHCKLEDCDIYFAHIHLSSEVTFNECYMVGDVQLIHGYDELRLTTTPRHTDTWNPLIHRWPIFNLTRRARP